MTIQELGSIGELIGAIATVATLIYLALQIRQNSFLQSQSVRALELSALDQSYRYGADFRALLLQNESLHSHSSANKCDLPRSSGFQSARGWR